MRTIAFDRFALAPGQRVLDLGCGRGRHLHALAAEAGLFSVGVDLNLADLDETRRGFSIAPQLTDWAVAAGDAAACPFADASFDRVICSEVLEHVADVEAVLREIARLTKPGGRFAVSVPRDWPEAICWRLSEGYRTEPGGHVRIFNRNDLKRRIEASGFRYLGGHGAHGLHSPYWWLKCLVWPRRDDHPAVVVYRRFLEWDILRRPLLTRMMSALADPIMGKSIVMYFVRYSAPESASS